MDWSDLFFHLHHYCGLNKYEIWQYTLPQILYLMKRINKHVKFQIEIQMKVLEVMGATAVGGSMPMLTETSSSSSDDGFEVATEDDINQLIKAFSG